MCTDNRPVTAPRTTDHMALADWLESQEFPSRRLVWRSQAPVSVQPPIEADEWTLDWLSSQELPSHPHRYRVEAAPLMASPQQWNARPRPRGSDQHPCGMATVSGTGGLFERSGERAFFAAAPLTAGRSRGDLGMRLIE